MVSILFENQQSYNYMELNECIKKDIVSFVNPFFQDIIQKAVDELDKRK